VTFDFHLFIPALLNALSYWWLIIPTVFFGLIIGAIPGLTAQNTLIMLLPLTLAMDTDMALIFMVALYSASASGGGVTSILMNIPGTPAAAATVLDGYPMAKQGRAQFALTISFCASALGGLLTSVAAVVLLPFLGRAGLYVNSVEMVVFILIGLALIAGIAADDMLKSLFCGFLGLLLGAVGTDFIYSAPRATFGFLELYEGIPPIAALVGVFAISETMIMIERQTVVTGEGREIALNAGWSEIFEGIWYCLSNWVRMVCMAGLGLFVGIIPGAGAGIAAFVAYHQSRLYSKHPELYGTGFPEGVLAPETANNASTSGTLIPAVAIGIPGGVTAAVMLIVLQYHGITPGPRLFQDRPDVVYSLFLGMTVAYVFMTLTIVPCARYFARITLVPTKLLVPIILCFVMVGAFAPRNYTFDMSIAIIFGVIGYIARKSGYHVVALLIGIILGPLLEQNLLRALRISQGDLTVLFMSPLGNILWAILAVTLIMPALRHRRVKRTRSMAAQS
jgi:putative tricarboxylic transport membrane protein